MASLEFDGMEQFAMDLKSIIETPTATKNSMLQAQAKVVMRAQESTMRSMGIYDSRQKYPSTHLVNSIKQNRYYHSADTTYTYVYPQGSRRRKSTTTRQGEIAFINEFGKSGQRARPAIKTANESCAEEAAEAAFKVYDSFLKNKNL